MLNRFKIGMAVAAVAAAGLSVPASAGDTRDAVRGGLLGAAGGAVVGAVVPGVSVGTGALVGGAGGALLGATSKKRHYRRTESRQRYWVDNRGRRHYR